MSRSPSSFQVDTGYLSGWSEINRLVRDEGSSFSGRERHCCFLNTRDGRFANVSAVTGLDLIDDGRGAALCDWDQDGDLDLWVSNRTGPRVKFLENVGDANGNFIELKLTGTKCNADAVGARVEMKINADSKPILKTVRAGEGFLSQSSKTLHFGIGDAVAVESIVVKWPGGSQSEFRSVQGGNRYGITQGESQLKRLETVKVATPELVAHEDEAKRGSNTRIVMPDMPLLANFDVQTDRETELPLFRSLPEQPFLLNVWQTSCGPCRKELTEFSEAEQRIRDLGIDVVALHVIQPKLSSEECWDAIDKFFGDQRFPFESMVAETKIAEKLNDWQKEILQKHDTFLLPTSFLVNEDLRVVAVYKGPISVDQLAKDVALLKMSKQQLMDELIPFEGHWFKNPVVDEDR